MPIPLLLIAGAVAFVIILCVALWVSAEATGGSKTDRIGSRR